MKTLQELCQLYLDHCAGRNYSGETIESRTRLLARFLCWLERVHRVSTADRLRRRQLQDYQLHLANHRTVRGTPLKPGSINNSIKALRGWLRFLHSRGYFTEQLADSLQYAKEPDLLPTSVLEHKELRQHLRKINTGTPLGFRNRTMLELLYSCGIRCGELLRLTPTSVDLHNRLLRVTGKGGKERMTPVGRTALRYLEGYIKAIRPFWRGAREQRALFLSFTGRPLERNGLKAVIKRAFQGASVEVTPHTFRRSCATELIRANANPYHVKELLGHASLASLKPYTRLTIADLQKTHARCHPRERDEQRDRGGR